MGKLSIGPTSTVDITALSTGWTGSSAPYTQSISATGVTANNIIVVTLASTATSAQFDAYSSGSIICSAQSADSVTLTAYGAVPSVDVPFTVLILG